MHTLDDPKVKFQVDNIMRQNNAGQNGHGHSSGHAFGSQVRHSETRKMSHKHAFPNKTSSLMSDQLNSKKLGESAKISFQNEYGKGSGNGGVISQREYKGYMETVPEIRVQSNMSVGNSVKLNESEMNQSNYRVQINETFGKQNQ